MKVRLTVRVAYFVVLGMFFTVLALGVQMAHYTPYSGRAYVEIGVVPVYSKVSGVIEEIYAEADRPIRRGEPIFRLDNRNYAAEVNRLEAMLAKTVKDLKSLDAQIRSTREEGIKARNILRQAEIDLTRDETLFQAKVIARKTREDSKLKVDNAAQDLRTLQARLEALENQRGNPAEESSEERQLKAELAIARNNLEDTTVRAPESGWLDYHQLYRGYAVNTQERYVVIHDLTHLTIHVDLLEKSAGKLRPGQRALVAFDVLPGVFFQAEIIGFGRLLQSKYTAPTQLDNIEEDTRWIRSAGRVRVQLRLLEEFPARTSLATGSKAAVAFLNPDHSLLTGLNRSWLAAVSWCNYIY